MFILKNTQQGTEDRHDSPYQAVMCLSAEFDRQRQTAHEMEPGQYEDDQEEWDALRRRVRGLERSVQDGGYRLKETVELKLPTGETLTLDDDNSL